MLADEAAVVFGPLMAAFPERFQTDTMTFFLEQLLGKDYAVALIARDKLIVTWRGKGAPTWTAFLELYTAEARRTAVETAACSTCGGSSWEEIEPDLPGRQMVVTRCRCSRNI